MPLSLSLSLSLSLVSPPSPLFSLRLLCAGPSAVQGHLLAVLDLEIQPLLLLLSPSVCLFLSPVCVNGVLQLCLLCVCVVWPLPGLHCGEEVAWLRSSGHLSEHLKLLNVLLDPYSSYVLQFIILSF